MNKLLYLSLIGFALLFVACEEKTEYVTKSYINEDAVVDRIKDPMRNIEWMKAIQSMFDGDGHRFSNKSSALIMFVAYGDSVKQFLEYNNHTTLDNGCLYDSEGNDCDFGTLRAGTSFSTSTSNMIQEMIDMQLDNGVGLKISSLTTRRKPPPPPFDFVEAIDTILNNATEIEILSCYRMDEVIK